MEIQTLLQIITSCVGLKNISGFSVADIAIIIGTSIFMVSTNNKLKKINETKANKKDINNNNTIVSDKLDFLSISMDKRMDDMYKVLQIIANK